MQDPITFVLMKNLFGLAVIAALTLLWGFLGHKLGFISGIPAPTSRSAIKDLSELNEISDRVSFSIRSSEDWIRTIEKGISSRENFFGVDTFLCCFEPASVDGSADFKTGNANQKLEGRHLAEFSRPNLEKNELKNGSLDSVAGQQPSKTGSSNREARAADLKTGSTDPKTVWPDPRKGEETKTGSLECFSKTKSKTFSMDCTSNLVYSVSLKNRSVERRTDDV